MQAELYQPLSSHCLEPHEIRLLRVVPNRLLHYELEAFKLEQAPPYIAFSYTWGPKKPTRTVLVNGIEFGLRENLYHFLDRLATRSSSEKLYASNGKPLQYLWIDQICINQKDMDERGSQVSLMADIYKAAEQVFVWLGKEQELFDKATDFMLEFIEQKLPCWPKNPEIEISATEDLLDSTKSSLDDTKDLLRRFGPHSNDLRIKSEKLIEKYDKNMDELVKRKDELTKDKDKWDELTNRLAANKQTLASVFQRNYWTRLWILQEFIGAKQISIFCGGCKLEGTMVQEFYQKLEILVPDHLEQFLGPAYAILRMRFVHSSQYKDFRWFPSFKTLLSVSAKLACSDPRDKIYGLLGLLESYSRIPVNYQIPASDVFWRTIKNLGERDTLFHHEADQLRDLGWAMGVSGKEEIARSPALVKQCRRVFRGQAPEVVFQRKPKRGK